MIFSLTTLLYSMFSERKQYGLKDIFLLRVDLTLEGSCHPGKQTGSHKVIVLCMIGEKI